MSATTDEDAAVAAIATLNELSSEQHTSHEHIQSILKDDTPFVDIQQLFQLYDALYFRSLLRPRVEVSWSPRLTLCAGICELVKDDNGKYTRIRLKLSEPLLKYRPRSDTVNTLLHEAIHAYFFVTTSWRHSRGDDGTGHGAGFLLLADAISNHGNYEITVYHSFHDEVDSYRTHVWKCDGPCVSQPPYFGLVRRSMNRAPGKSDPWWAKHETECGGIYTKIAEPEMTKARIDAMSMKERAGRQKNKIDSWVQKSAADRKEGVGIDGAAAKTNAEVIDLHSRTSSPSDTRPKTAPRKRTLAKDDNDIEARSKKIQVACPICDTSMDESRINEHLDSIHGL